MAETNKSENENVSKDETTVGEDEYAIEFTEEDVVAYLVDEDDVEIGVVLLDEDGNEVEYIYEGEVREITTSAEGIEIFSKEELKETATGMVDVVKDGAAVVMDLKDALSEITESFNLKSFLKK